jgi:hypothetical protein
LTIRGNSAIASAIAVIVVWVGEWRQLNPPTGQRILGHLNGVRRWNIHVDVLVVVVVVVVMSRMQCHGRRHHLERRHWNNERIPPP